jgi:hypothetical protein
MIKVRVMAPSMDRPSEHRAARTIALVLDALTAMVTRHSR